MRREGRTTGKGVHLYKKSCKSKFVTCKNHFFCRNEKVTYSMSLIRQLAEAADQKEPDLDLKLDDNESTITCDKCQVSGER